MRIRIVFDHQARELIAEDYHACVSAWIKELLEEIPYAIQTRYPHLFEYIDKKVLFTFKFKARREIIDQTLRSNKYKYTNSVLDISLYIKDEAWPLLLRLLNEGQRLQIKTIQYCATMSIGRIKRLPNYTPTDQTVFSLKTPLLVKNQSTGQLVSPNDQEEYLQWLLYRLVEKHNMSHLPKFLLERANAFRSRLVILSRIEEKAVYINKKAVVGHRFSFRLRAPAELLRIGYYSGFGNYNRSAGAGMTIVKQ